MEAYWNGRSKGTLTQYSSSYRKWIKYLKERGAKKIELDELSVSHYLVHLGDHNSGVSSMNQFGAMIALLREAKGLDSLATSGLIRQVKKSSIKKVNGKKKRKIRMTMKKKHMNLMLKAVYYAEGEISLKNKCILCMVASMFYCLK